MEHKVLIKKLKVIVLSSMMPLVLFVNLAQGGDGNMSLEKSPKNMVETEAFVEAFIDTVFPTNRANEPLRRRREDIRISIQGHAPYQAFRYIDSAVVEISKLISHDILIVDKGDVNTVIFFTDDVYKDSLGAFRKYIQQFLLPDETVESAFRTSGNSRCLVVTPGTEDKVSGLAVVLSNRSHDFDYVKYCFKFGLLRSLGMLGRRKINKLKKDGEFFQMTDLDKKILAVLYSESLSNLDFQGAVKYLRTRSK